MSGSALLVAGTTSDAGKTLLVAGLCRLLARRGVDVAPFKAQNMSLNSAVADHPDGGFAEIGRGQAVQAIAAGLVPHARMNPVLLKPGGEGVCHVVLDGRPWVRADAQASGSLADQLRPRVIAALAHLRRRHQVVVCEGAGGIAEPNLRDSDLANAGLAEAADLPIVVVADIERGGAFASLYGSWALLAPADRSRIAGFVLNRFGGDLGLLDPAITDLTRRTGVPVIGVVPHLGRLHLEAEDSLGLVDLDGGPPLGAHGLHVAVARLPHLSNFTDLDAIGAEPGVTVTFTSDPRTLEAADLAVLPGTRATVADLAWLRTRGIDRAILARARAGRPILGICGGHQMLGQTITDDVEGPGGTVHGLGLLPTQTTFHPEKVVRRVTGHSPALACPASGYEIRHGRTTVLPSGRRRLTPAATPAVIDEQGEPGGVLDGPVLGTSWHGLAEHDDARRGLLSWAAGLVGVRFQPGAIRWSERRLAALDRVADALEQHLDLGGLPLPWPVASSPDPRSPSAMRSPSPLTRSHR